MAPCSRVPQWYLYISASLVTFLGGILVIGLTRLGMLVYFRRVGAGWKELNDSSSTTGTSNSSQIHGRFSFFSRVRAAGRTLLSGDAWWSKTLVVVMWLLNMASCIHFLVNVNKFSVDDCGPVLGDASEYTWLAMCCVFFCYYVVRFAAATDKLAMWTGIYSIVDHFTIFPSFVGLYFDVNWLGLRFLRLLHIMQVTDILQLTHVIKSNRHIRFVHVVTLLVGVWFCSAGFVHLTENNGDPFTDDDDNKAQYLTYWECVYWLLITMSTVGYGDISPQTNISRAFIILFIMGTIAKFASVIPELVSAMASSSKYAKPYKRTYGKKHIVVCGHITYESVTPFLRNFVHADTKAKTRDTHVVFLGSNTPNLELEAFFRRNCNEITFIEGSAMDSASLQDVKLAHADACVILANRKASDPDEADAETLMRVIAVKNYRPHIRVIVQLRRYHTKRYLLHIPGWNWDRDHGDSIICISELSLAILAQNCLAPGFATLLSNLFTMRSSLPEKFNSWRDDYQYGASNEIYSETFSKSFYDLTFRQAAELCYLQHDVLLVAVNVCNKRKTHMKVNPGNNVVIKPGDVGFFIAQSSQQVARVASFEGVVSYITKDNEMQTKSDINSNEDEPGLTETQMTISDDAVSSPLADETPSRDMLEGSGMFHWCPSRKLDDCLLDDFSTRERNFCNHVIVVFPANDAANPVELVNFVLPLRASSFRYKELKDIVIFVTDVQFLRKKWEDISNFPNIYVYEGDTSRRADLRAVNVNRSAMSVILSNQSHIVIDNTHHIDKEAVLATLNMKAMCGQALHRCLMLTSGSSEHRILELKKSIQIDKSQATPFITLLEMRSNGEFLEHDDDDCPDTPFYLTMTYASGRAFAVSMLDSLMSCVYINSDLLTMVRTLTTGASEAEYEQILADGLGLTRQQSLVDVSAARNRCRVAQLDLEEGRLAQLEHNNRYGRLFVQALNRYGILCLGLYRVMDPSGDVQHPLRRFVMTHPPPSVNLLPSDKVFVLEPYLLEQTSGSVAGSYVASSTASRASSRVSRADRPPPYLECTGQTDLSGFIADRNRRGRSKNSAKTPQSRTVIAADNCTTHI